MASFTMLPSFTKPVKLEDLGRARGVARVGTELHQLCRPSNVSLANLRHWAVSRGLVKPLVARAAAEVESPEYYEGDCPPQGCLADMTVADIMSTKVFTVRPEDSIFRAMEILVDNRVSGVPVIDDDDVVVGVVSGYDLLAVESTPGMLDDSDGFFPPVGRCKELYNGSREVMWNEFKKLRQGLQKSKGTTVGEVMRPAVTVSPDEDVMEASNLILRKQLHRMAVVDNSGKLVGLISRGDILRATIQNFRFFMESQDEEDDSNGMFSKAKSG